MNITIAILDVQWSADGINFEILGIVYTKAANGKSNTDLVYEYSDTQPMTGNNYYRLQQVDINGNKNYSEIRNIVWTNRSVIKVYPNPTRDILNIDFTTKVNALIEVKLFDMQGHVVKSVLANSNSGLSNIQLSLGELATGIYSVQVFEDKILSQVHKVRKYD